MRLSHLRLITVLTINPEPRLWKGKLIVRGITAAKYLFKGCAARQARDRVNK